MLINSKKWLIIYLIIGSLYLGLFLVNNHVPFQDYPNHLLESRVILNPQAYEPFYSVTWYPVPNLLSQIFFISIGSIIPLAIAGRIFLSLTCIFFALGAFLFAHTYLRKNFLAGLSIFLVFGTTFFWRGYLNYSMGTALAILFIPLSHTLHYKLKPLHSTIATLFLYSLLYFTHYFPASIFMLFIICERFFEHKQKIKELIPFFIFPILLSLPYVIFSESQSFLWEYGTGIWKLSSIKRVVGLPYVSTIESVGIVSAVNIYNAFIYIIIISGILLWILKWKQMVSAYSYTKPFSFFIGTLFIMYILLPTKLGLLEVDNRFSYFLFLFTIPTVITYLQERFYRFKVIIYSTLVILIISNITISYIQFSSSQKRLSHSFNEGQSVTKPKLQPTPINQYNNLNNLTSRSFSYQILSKVKLHTDISQVSLAELHVDCYYYYYGGNPPTLFTTSIISRNEL